jgi:hypothetical protein
MSTLIDTYYLDQSGELHFLSAANQKNAVDNHFPLPDPSWTVATVNQVAAILNPPVTLAQAVAAQLLVIQAACEAAIVGGQQSSALGTVYTYPSGVNDQQNLTANVLSSMLPGLASNWTTEQLCESSTNVWAYLPHTAVQIQQVGTDVKNAILTCLVKRQNLQNEITAATSVAAVQAIVWS